MECDRDCERCTYADCMVDQFEYQHQHQKKASSKLKKKPIKVFHWTSLSEKFEEEDHIPNRSYDF